MITKAKEVIKVLSKMVQIHVINDLKLRKRISKELNVIRFLQVNFYFIVQVIKNLVLVLFYYDYEMFIPLYKV